MTSNRLPGDGTASEASTKTTGGRVPRVGDDPEALRELMLVAGLEVLERDGLNLAAQSLGYARVFAHLERAHGVSVARASVHERIWASNEDFRRDVVAATVSHLPTEILGGQGEQVRDIVIDMYSRGLTASERVSELSLLTAPIAFDFVAALPALRQVQVAKAIASPFNNPLSTEALQGSLRDRSDSVLSRLRVRLAELTAGLGLRARSSVVVDDDTAHELLGVVAINAFVGAFLDVHAGFDDVRRPLAFKGRSADDPLPWTILSIGMDALISHLFEPADDGPAPDVPVPGAPLPPRPPTIDVGDSTKRRPRHKLRELAVAAGVEVLLEQRLDLQPESLSYASVFAHVERTRGVKVYRSSVHRKIWDSHDDYWLDVLTRAIQSEPEIGQRVTASIESQAPQPGETPTGGDPTGEYRPDDPLQAAMDIIRTLTEAATTENLKSPDFLRRQAIKAALLTEPESERIAALRQAFHDSQQERMAKRQAVLAEHVLPLGFEVRPEAGISEDEALRVVVTLMSAVAAGAVFDRSAGVEAVARTYLVRRHDDAGGFDDWQAPGVAAWAIFSFLFQPSA